MANEFRLEGEHNMASVKTRPAYKVPGDLAEQVNILADQPSEGVLWSDVFDHLRHGFLAVRRLVAIRHAHTAR